MCHDEKFVTAQRVNVIQLFGLLKDEPIPVVALLRRRPTFIHPKHFAMADSSTSNSASDAAKSAPQFQMQDPVRYPGVDMLNDEDCQSNAFT